MKAYSKKMNTRRRSRLCQPEVCTIGNNRRRSDSEPRNTTNAVTLKEQWTWNTNEARKMEDEKLALLVDFVTNIETNIKASMNELKEDTRHLINENTRLLKEDTRHLINENTRLLKEDIRLIIREEISETIKVETKNEIKNLLKLGYETIV